MQPSRALFRILPTFLWCLGTALAATAQAPPPTPSAIADASGAAASSKAFAEALQAGTTESFERFLAAWPEAAEAPEARDRLEWLREDAAYEQAVARNDEGGYEEFLRQFPKSVLRAEVELRLKALADARAREEEERRRAADAERRRAEAHAEAARLDTPTAWRVFVAAYPDSSEAAVARHRVEILEADDAAFAEAARSEEGLKNYLLERPEGRHAAEARARLDSAARTPASPAPPLAVSPSATAFAEALSEGTIGAFERFLATHPASPEAAEARDRIDWLREDAAYEAAVTRNDEEAYRKFLDYFPQSVLRAEVELRLKALEDARARAEAEQQAADAAAKRKAEAHAAAARLDTASGWRLFLAAYPDALEADAARRRAEALEADDAAFAAASRSREGLESYLRAEPAGRHAAEARDRLEALRRAAAPVTTPPAPASPLATLPSSSAFAQALAEDSAEGLEKFLAAYPDAPETPAARGRLSWLREDAAYRNAVGQGTEEALRQFLAEHPRGIRRAEVELRLKVLGDARARTEADSAARAAADQRRAEAHAEALRLDSPGAWRLFLAAYPEAPETDDARRRAETLEADDAAFAEAGSSEAGLRAYLRARPQGRHAAEARARVAAADAAARPSSAESAQPASPPPARPAAAASAPAPGSPQTLVAAYTSKAPNRNGRADDPAWQAAQALEIPLAGGPGPRAVRVKAVHDGRSLYLLAQWPDATRDGVYRPWVWDPAQKSYRQEDRVDDGFAVLFYRGQAPAEACMLAGPAQDADVWLWRAFWSELSGLAEDGSLKVSREPFSKARPHPSTSRGQVWIRQEADAGAPGWSFYMPTGQQGARIPSHRRARASGSRADVTALGSWAGGTWTVELSRALDTGHGDDLSLREGGTYAVSFGAYNRAEGGRHATSGEVRLEVRQK